MVPRLRAIATVMILIGALCACSPPGDSLAGARKHGVVWSEGDGSCGVPGIDPTVGFGPFSC